MGGVRSPPLRRQMVEHVGEPTAQPQEHLAVGVWPRANGRDAAKGTRGERTAGAKHHDQPHVRAAEVFEGERYVYIPQLCTAVCCPTLVSWRLAWSSASPATSVSSSCNHRGLGWGHCQRFQPYLGSYLRRHLATDSAESASSFACHRSCGWTAPGG